MPYMYIVECSDGTFYTGSTKDLERRLSEHQSGKGAKYTRARLPVKLLYYEVYPSVGDAFRREKQVQGWRRKKKKALIDGRQEDLPLLSRKKVQ